MRSIRNLSLVCFLCLSVLAAQAATHYLVPTNTSAANPYTNWAMAGTSVIDVVNAAMTNASTPRIIWVTNGVYVLTNSVSITNGVTLQSVNGRDVTIFNGNALYKFSMSHTSSVLNNLTITNCYSASWGGGISLSSGTITNCLITDCISAANGGGGIYMGAAIAIVANCVIRRNRLIGAGQGGGVYTISGTIKNCTIEKNSSIGHGAGIMTGGTDKIYNCLIVDNFSSGTSLYGGGIYIATAGALLINCTIVSNYAATSGGGLAIASAVAPQTNIVLNCIIYNNLSGGGSGRDDIVDAGFTPYKLQSTFAYSCSSTSNQYGMCVIGPQGNTLSNPNFINSAGGADRNYRFNRPSPCFNTGTNQLDWMAGAVDLDGHHRIDVFSGIVDMGCYEYLLSGTMFSGR